MFKMDQVSCYNELISSCQNLAQNVLEQLAEEVDVKPVLRIAQKSPGIDFLIQSETVNNALLAAVECDIAGNVFR
jgi:hypothetical protein